MRNGRRSHLNIFMLFLRRSLLRELAKEEEEEEKWLHPSHFPEYSHPGKRVSHSELVLPHSDLVFIQLCRRWHRVLGTVFFFFVFFLFVPRSEKLVANVFGDCAGGSQASGSE